MSLSVPSRDPDLPRLPLEVIQHVISQLDTREDKVTLSKCALIAPYFQAPAQRLLFSSVTLFYVVGYDKVYQLAGIDTPQSLRFLRSITDSRHLGGLVRRLEIHFSDRVVASSNMIDAKDPTFFSLDAILRSLVCLEAFIFDSKRSIYWGTLSDAHKRSMLTALRANSLQELRLLGLSFLTRSSFCYSSQLKKLTITNIEEHNDSMDADVQPPNSIRLESLTIGWSAYGTGVITPVAKFLLSSTCPLDLSNLTTLDIGTYHADSWDIVPLLDLCSHSLRCLNLPVPEEVLHKPSYPIINLQNLIHLSQLCIHGRIISRWIGAHRNPMEAMACPTTWIGAVLRTLPFGNTVVTNDDPSVEIHLEIENVSPGALESAHWGDLVDGLHCHPGLRRKSLNLSFNDYVLPQIAKPHGPEIFQVRMRLLKDDLDLQRLGNDVIFDLTERFSTTPRKFPS